MEEHWFILIAFILFLSVFLRKRHTEESLQESLMTDIVFDIMYVAVTIAIIVGVWQGEDVVPRLYWTRIALIAIMGIYALLELGSFVRRLRKKGEKLTVKRKSETVIHLSYLAVLLVCCLL